MNSGVIAIIQARMGSTRLPGKVLLPLEGSPVLMHIIKRVTSCRTIKDIVVATTLLSEDVSIVKLCSSMGIRVFCGSSQNVLSRYYQIANILKPSHIVRITADSPLFDPQIGDLVISQHLASRNDYTSNVCPATFPVGLGIEIFSFKTLIRIWDGATTFYDHEHVTPVVRNNLKQYKTENVINLDNLAHYRWTLDTKKDYANIQKIFQSLRRKKYPYAMKTVLSILKKQEVNRL